MTQNYPCQHLVAALQSGPLTTVKAMMNQVANKQSRRTIAHGTHGPKSAAKKKLKSTMSFTDLMGANNTQGEDGFSITRCTSYHGSMYLS